MKTARLDTSPQWTCRPLQFGHLAPWTSRPNRLVAPQTPRPTRHLAPAKIILALYI